MKKVKNMLFILVMLLVPSFVNASSVEGIYENKWENKYKEDTDSYYDTVVKVEDGVVVSGSEHYCETVEDVEECADVGILVKYDNEGNKVWANSLFDEADGFGSDSIILDMVATDEGIIALVAETIYNGDDEENENYLGIVEIDLNGEFIDSQGVAEGVTLDNGAHLNYYNGILAIAVDEGVVFLDSELEELYFIEDIVMPNVLMNKNGIYVSGVNADNLTSTIVKYDYKFNEIVSRNFNFVDLDIDDAFTYVQFVTGMSFDGEDIYVSSLSFENGSRIINVDKDLNLINTGVLDDTFVWGVSPSHNGVVLLEIQVTTCDIPEESSLEDVSVALSSNCAEESKFYLSKYDDKMNNLWKTELSYFPEDIVEVDDGVVVVGYASDDFDLGIASKYDHVDYEINVVDDGNGKVSMNNATVTGDEVEIVVEPKEGYQVKKVVVTTASGETIEVTDYKFIMPSEDVEIYVEFEKLFNPNTGLSNPFVMFGVIAILSLIGYVVIKKKKYI